jgi:hypothetical protein
MLCSFESLNQVQQSAIIANARKRMLSTRQELVNQGHDPETIWYGKMEYINNHKPSNTLTFEICECGEVLNLQKVVSDKPDVCQGRKVTYLCKCGKHQTIHS